MDSTTLWIILLIQIALGGIDTVYHHEFTERLAWRPSQKNELCLHGIRNLIYGAFFMVIGFAELHGAFAFALLGLLTIELLITLTDFVEEDRTRKLPWTERILHTLLTFNYGLLMALLVPVFWNWAQQPTGFSFTYHGILSLLMLPAAIGVSIFGLRDLAAARRLRRITQRPAKTLAAGLAPHQSILITGGTGFIGKRLVAALVDAGHEVTVLTRRPEIAAEITTPLKFITDLKQIPNTTQFDAIINLAGHPVIGGLWTMKLRRKVLFSRLRISAGLRKLVARLEKKPTTIINASAIGFYGIKNDEVLTEYSHNVADNSFSHRSCAIIEKHANKFRRYGLRVVSLRIGLVLDTDGGVLGNMLFPFEFGLGGPFGSGKQWMSWISRDDTVRLIVHAISREELEGPLNATAPTPVRNNEFAQALGTALHRPTIFFVPAFLLNLAGDLGREIFLGGQQVLPTRALETGFTYLDPDLLPLLQRQTGARKDQITPIAGKLVHFPTEIH